MLGLLRASGDVESKAGPEAAPLPHVRAGTESGRSGGQKASLDLNGAGSSLVPF